MKEYIEIPQKMSDYIEGLMYEVNARKDLLTFMVRQDDILEERFKQYHEEYLKFFAKYEMAKDELTETYIRPKYKNTEDISWNLNFRTHTLEVTIK